MTTRAEYLSQPEVKVVTAALAALMPNWKINYVSRFKRLREKRLEAHGVEQVLENYAWPSRFRVQRSLKVGRKSYQPNDVVESYDWESTQQTLEALSQRLQSAISHNHDEDVLAWADCILDWGMGTRGSASKNYLRSLRKRGIASYLREVDSVICSADTTKISTELAPVVNSGMAKIHSLASVSNLIIYDSRVALALGSAINYSLSECGHTTIPEALSLGRSYERTPLILVGHANQPILSRDWRWLKSQVRATWILEDVLLHSNIFQGSLAERVHCLEAALFMIGSQPKAVSESLRDSRW